MNDKQQELIKQTIKTQLKCSEVYSHIEKYNFISRDEYFNSYSHIWDIAKKEPESIEYNQGLYRLNHFSINEDISLSALENLFVKCYGESYRNEIYNPDEYFANDTLGEHHNKIKFIQDLEELVKNDNYLLDYEDLELIFSNYCEYSDDIFESLAYWTVYFEPRVFDEAVAYQCGLVPFKYSSDAEERELLALGGCGMDLSPKLDAYQAIVDGTIDNNSTIIRYPESDYFSYVVGEQNTKEAIKSITREKQKIVFETYI